MAGPSPVGTPLITTVLGAASIDADLPADMVNGEWVGVSFGVMDAAFGAGPSVTNVAALEADGWSVLTTIDGFGSQRYGLLLREVDGSEDPTVTINVSASSNIVAESFRIENASGVTDLDSGTGNTGSTTAMTCPSIDPPDDNSLIVRIAHTRESSSISIPGTDALLVTGGAGAGAGHPRLSSSYVLQALSGSTGTADFVSTGTNRNWGTFTIAFAPMPGPTITDEPDSITVYEGQDAAFTITATGVGTLHYQWKFNGGNVGSDSSSYTRTGCGLADNGGEVTCDVTDDNGTTVSDAAILTVLGAARLAWIRA